MKRENIIATKSFQFVVKVVTLAKKIQNNHKEYILTKQLIRSGTSIGAMVREAEHAESKKDFIHKMSIGLKEANETRYWSELLYACDYLLDVDYREVNNDIVQIIKLLASIVKSSKMSN